MTVTRNASCIPDPPSPHLTSPHPWACLAVSAAVSEASPRAIIMEAVQDAMAEAFGEAYRGCNPKVTPATRPEFGDYQVS